MGLRKRRETGREKLFEEIITEKSSYLRIQVRESRYRKHKK